MDRENILAQVEDTGGRWHHISLKMLSKYHFQVKRPGPELQSKRRFKNLKVMASSGEFTLGPCRLSKKGELYELYPENNIYNLDRLIHNGELSDLKSHFSSLKIVISQQRYIKPEFKDYINRLNYELNCYKHFFDEMDIKLTQEKEGDCSLLQMAVIKSRYGREFTAYIDESLEELRKIIKDFNKKEHQNHGYYLRNQLRGIIRCSDLLERTNVKPRGYAGDSAMMKMLYRNNYRGRKIFEKLLYKHAVNTDTAQAVRNRRVLVPQVLVEAKKRADNEQFRVMSVACGPAMELLNLYKNYSEELEGLKIVLLDQDREALNEARTSVSQIEKRLEQPLDVTYLEESVRTMMGDKELNSIFGKFNFIYSMGLFDYLTPLVGRAVLNSLYSLLEPGGELLIGNFHVRNSQRWYMSYWMDWELYYREEEEMYALAKAHPEAATDVFFEDTNNQMFLHIRKPK